MRYIMHSIIYSILLINYVNGFALPFEGLYRLDIIHYNDFHARFEETSVLTPTCRTNDNYCLGGFPRIYHHIQTLLKEKPNAVLLNAGDSFQGTFWYTLLKWNITQEFMNLLPHDAHAIGNHEFDDGPEGLAPYLSALKAPVVAANMDSTNEPSLQGLYKPHIIIERSGRKIGIIGLITTDTKILSSPGNVVFTDPGEATKREAEILRDKGVDIIILLSHCGLEMDKELARDYGEYIDVIIGGHSHSLLWNGPSPSKEDVAGPYPVFIETSANKRHKTYRGLVLKCNCRNTPTGPWRQTSNLSVVASQANLEKARRPYYGSSRCFPTEAPTQLQEFDPIFNEAVSEHTINLLIIALNDVFIVQASAFTKYMGNLSLYFDFRGDFVKWDGGPIFLNRSIPEDPDIKEKLEPYAKMVHEAENVAVGETQTALKFEDCVFGECALGDMLVDAFVEHAKAYTKSDDIHLAFMQRGNIKSTISQGTITQGEIFELLPYSDRIQTFELQGKHVMEALERSVSDAWAYDPFKGPWVLQVSGLQVTYNVTLPEGSRVTSVTIGEKQILLDAGKYYRVTAPAYLADGGDGFSMFKDNRKNIEVIGRDGQVVVAYIKKKSPLNINTDGRIVINN